MFLFSITLSRSPLFGEELTLRLMSGKEYQSYAEIPRKSMYSLETVGFAGRLKTLRKAKGMTQEKAAEELNISIEHLGNMERGQGKPSLELLVEIALYRPLLPCQY